MGVYKTLEEKGPITMTDVQGDNPTSATEKGTQLEPIGIQEPVVAVKKVNVPSRSEHICFCLYLTGF